MGFAARALAIALVLAAAGCGGGSSGPASTPEPAPSGEVTNPGGGVAGDPIFDQSRLHEVRLVLDPADWAALQRNYLQNQYYAARVVLDGTALDQAGIRSRGMGSRNSEKPALKVDFNRYVPGQEYGGYKNLVLDNQITDPSFVGERLSFAVFEAMGIPAPRSSFTRLFVNEQYWGLYQITEPVSKPFLQSRLGEDGGNLFEYNWLFVWDFSYLGDNAARYVPTLFQPQTNEDELDPSGLVDFIRAASETPDAEFVRVMSSWLDLERFLTHLAVENATAESDGLLGQEGVNNFYLYQYRGQRRFVFIPWDKDTAWATASVPIYQRVETNVLARRLLLEEPMRQVYTGALRRAVTSFVNDRWLGPRLDQAHQQIREAALADPHKIWTNAQFEQSLTDLHWLITARETDVLAQLGGR